MQRADVRPREPGRRDRVTVAQARLVREPPARLGQREAQLGVLPGRQQAAAAPDQHRLEPGRAQVLPRRAADDERRRPQRIGRHLARPNLRPHGVGRGVGVEPRRSLAVPEHRLPEAPTGADLGMRLHGLPGELHPVGRQPVVVVHEADDVVRRRLDGPQPRVADAQARLGDDPERRRGGLRPARPRDGRRVVGRGVVDEHDLPRQRRRHPLGRQVGERGTQAFARF